MITLEEATTALKYGLRVEFGGSRNYVISGIIKRVKNGFVFYQLELSEICDKKEHNLSRDRIGHIVVAELRAVSL